jgi:hypothetical protein
LPLPRGFAPSPTPPGAHEAPVRPAGSPTPGAIRYELFLRSAAPLASEIVAAMAEAVARADGSLRLDPFVAQAGTLGVDIAAPLDSPQAARALCAVCFQLAATHALSLFDPQLSRVVTEGERDLILEQFERTSAFDSGALPSATATPARRLSSGARLWLVMILGGAVLLALMRALSCSFL